jgi:zinc protease
MRLLVQINSTAIALSSLGIHVLGYAQQALSTGGKAQAFTQVEGVSEYRLANGLRVLLAPDASKPTTTVNITYLVGSRHENYGETGMAHLLEHLVFKGTPSRGNIMQELGKRGMRFNGTTSYDRTNYFETFAANDDNLQWTLEMEADRMVNSFIARTDLETEFSVVRNEMEMGENNPRRTLWKYMAAAAYDWHNYGKSTIGARSDVESVRIENLQAFYRQYYQPDNAVLIITGKVEVAKTLALVERYFGAIPKPTRSLPVTYTRDPVQQGAREVSVKRVGDTQLAAVLYHTAAASHPDAVAMDALAEILADTPNGRLHKELVEKNKAVSIAPWNFSLAEPGYIVFMAELGKEQSIADLRAGLQATLENMKAQPVSDQELQRAKTSWMVGFDDTMNDPQRLAMQLSESAANGDWRLFFWERDRLESLTVAQVQAAAENYFKESNRTFGQFIPTAAPERSVIPETVDVVALLANYQGRKAVETGENFDASPANIGKRTLRSTLPVGMHLALLSKTTRGQTVSGQLQLDFGDAQSLQGQATVSALTARMLMRGAGALNRAALSSRLDELKAKISVDGGASSVTVSFETVRQHLPQVLEIVRDIVRAPMLQPAEFDLLRKERMTQIESQRSDPQAMASQAMRKALDNYPAGDVRKVLSFDEILANLRAASVQDVQGFYKSFYGASHAKLAMVGDFDAAAVQTQSQALWGDWRSAKPYTRLGKNAYSAAPARLMLAAPDKPNAVYFAALPLSLRDDAPDYIALAIGNRVLGGGSNNRLEERLRQKEGISYYAGSQFSASSFEPVADLILVAIHAPQNLARLQTAMREETERLVRDGVTAQELADAKKSMLEEAKISLAQDGALSGTLLGQLSTGRTMDYTAQRLAKIEATSLEEVNAAIRKYMDWSRLVHVHAGDFAATGKAAVQ